MNIARAAYASDSPHLYDAGSSCRKAEANLVLYGKEDNDVGFDKAAIKTGGANDSDSYRFFYSIKDYHGRRLLLKKYQQSWQGDMHDLLSVDAKADVNKLIGSLASLDISDGKNLPADCKLVTSGNWNCPWLVGGKDATGIEAIELGHPVVVLSDWAVYSVTADGAVKKVAVVKFRPTAERVATLIPNAVSRNFIFCWIKSSVSRQKTKGPMALLRECESLPPMPGAISYIVPGLWKIPITQEPRWTPD